jgi:dihydropteroate synthase
MPPKWIARHLVVPRHTDRIVVPGHCRGDLAPVVEKAGGVTVERGPEDLRDLPRYFGQGPAEPPPLIAHDISILAEINHAPQLGRAEIIRMAQSFRADGADIIDLGCDPGGPWGGVADAVKALRDQGLRVSIDSFDPVEVEAAVGAGAELVLSVNATNRQHAQAWGAEVVVIPDQVGTLDGLEASLEYLTTRQVRFRIDPIVEPIGFGFAASLARYQEVRRRFPEAELLMGIGNLTELTDADSAGLNTLLIGFCQELGIRSVLTTAVINWARSSVREIDLARRLMHHAVTHRTLPKHLEPRLILLRDPRVPRFGPETLGELARRVKDPNWRIYAEDGQMIAFNHDHYLVGTDAFALFAQMGIDDPAHAFYLGWEMMKASTALTLGKAYRQDQALDWGFLTQPEISHRSRPAGVGELEARDALTNDNSDSTEAT